MNGTNKIMKGLGETSEALFTYLSFLPHGDTVVAPIPERNTQDTILEADIRHSPEMQKESALI
jgi:hypothetical protein